jgi:hypothetical protein
MELCLRPFGLCIVLIVVVCWQTVAIRPVRSAEAPRLDGPDDEEPLDMNAVKAKAEAGNVRSQAALADFFMVSSDFTNAVIWYRRAAENGDVSAQLSLASLLITGRGAPKDPKEAAKWLRQAANGIESAKPIVKTSATSVAVTTNTAGGLTPKTTMITNISASSTKAMSAPTVTNTNATNVARVPRVNTLHVAEPVFQEVNPTQRPPGGSL